MSHTTRRDFLSKAGSAAVAGAAIRTGHAKDSPNDRINVAVVGFHSRGMAHIRGYAQLPNVRVAALCDVDERLFPPAVAEVERLSGHRPITEYDLLAWAANWSSILRQRPSAVTPKPTEC
jgi:hypothetical protein